MIFVQNLFLFSSLLVGFANGAIIRKTKSDGTMSPGKGTKSPGSSKGKGNGKGKGTKNEGPRCNEACRLALPNDFYQGCESPTVTTGVRFSVFRNANEELLTVLFDENQEDTVSCQLDTSAEPTTDIPLGEALACFAEANQPSPSFLIDSPEQCLFCPIPCQIDFPDNTYEFCSTDNGDAVRSSSGDTLTVLDDSTNSISSCQIGKGITQEGLDSTEGRTCLFGLERTGNLISADSPEECVLCPTACKIDYPDSRYQQCIGSNATVFRNSNGDTLTVGNPQQTCQIGSNTPQVGFQQKEVIACISGLTLAGSQIFTNSTKQCVFPEFPPP